MKYLIIGGGYVLEKHLKAIKETQGEVVGIVNRSDSIGIIGNYFDKAEHFNGIDSIPTSLYLENEVIPVVITATHTHLDIIKDLIMLKFPKIIVEKPPVENMAKYNELLEISKDIKIYPVLQMRYSDNNLNILSKLAMEKDDIYLTINTPRGIWYLNTWKANKKLSGGMRLNIGIHYLDLIYYFCNQINENILFTKITKTYSEYKDVRFTVSTNNREYIINLSIDKSMYPMRVAYNRNRELYKFEFNHSFFYRSFLESRVADIEDKALQEAFRVLSSSDDIFTH